jgi:glyoxylase-like metal-dependent hydrolase (beta-lactamase superfamily II)
MTQRWFDIVVIQEHQENHPAIYAIFEPGHSEEVISYLLIGINSAILVDTGMGVDNIKSVVDQYTNLPVQVVNTHAHWDHIGGNHQFEEVAIHEAEVEKLRQGVPDDFLRIQMRKDNLSRPLPTDFRLENYHIHPSNPTRLLKDGDYLILDGYNLKVLHLPGHSPGSICLWNADSGHLFTGDVIYPGPLYSHIPGSNLQEYIKSIKKLRKILNSVETLFPAHNQTPLDRSFLEEIIGGFEDIESGSASLVEGETYFCYNFPRFQVLAPKRMT